MESMVQESWKSIIIMIGKEVGIKKAK